MNLYMKSQGITKAIVIIVVRGTLMSEQEFI